METTGWGSSRTVADSLFSEAYKFDFFQAVSLLEQLKPEAVRLGTGGDATLESVRFVARPTLGFAASDIYQLRANGVGQSPTMTVDFMGLASPNGPLPSVYAEWLLSRVAARDYASRDFLDMFHHRLLAFFYRTRQTHRPTLGNRPPPTAGLAGFLFALSGFAPPLVRDQFKTASGQKLDMAVLRYAGLLSQESRSLVGLSCMLSDYFGVPFVGRPFQGDWLTLDPDQHTVIGQYGKNNQLGFDTLLGSHVWDEHSKVMLVIGPLSFEDWQTFLPDGACYPALAALTRLYLGPAMDVDIFLQLAENEAPPILLEGDHARLGWTTWLEDPATDAIVQTHTLSLIDPLETPA